MPTNARLLGLPRDWTLILVPLLAIAAARFASRLPVAAEYPRTATLLLIWLVADALMLSFIARRLPATISRQEVLAVLAGAAVTALLVMPEALRSALLTMPAVAMLMLAVVAGHAIWGAIRARRGFVAARGSFGDRAVLGLAELVPHPMARFLVAELRLLRLALFQWRTPPDVPAGSIGFGYHKHLVPVFSVILVLQLLELGVVHVLVAIWSPTAALILSALSAAGLVYLVGLLKSFRLKPVLLDDHGIRVRTGILVDRHIPLAAIATVRTSFSSAEVKRQGTNEAGLFAWPNILVELKQPIDDPGLLRPHRKMTAIAFRLDEPNEFVRLVEQARAKAVEASS